MKREHEFALKSLSQLPPSLGRTRSCHKGAPDATPAASSLAAEDPIPDLTSEDEEDGGTSGKRRVREDEKDVTASMPAAKVKKMEIKMSKKVDSVRKIPGNARDLLLSNLLEGLHVMYIVPNSMKPTLRGVIKDGSIVCFCATCKGAKSVSAYNFELHAASNKKHPSDYIFLENGISLRGVLDKCKNSQVDMLAETVKNAVSPMPKNPLRNCMRCKGSLHDGDAISFILCESCQQATQLRYIDASNSSAPCPSDVTDSSTPSHVTVATPLRPVEAKCLPDSPIESSSSAPLSKNPNCSGKLTKKDLGLHKLALKNVDFLQGVEVYYYVSGKKLCEGYIKDGGIHCRCCNTVVSPSQFEAHAGQATRKKPYNYIFTSNGVSLHELAMALAEKQMLATRKSDDLCNMCQKGGDLVICGICPRAFHKECVGLSAHPDKVWHCPSCINNKKKDKAVAYNDNARAAGRVQGVDAVEQIFKRCIRIVSSPDTDLGGCKICKFQDFNNSCFDDRTVIICDQCEKEYHVGCLREKGIADLKELPEGEWFCSHGCSEMHCALLELVLNGDSTLCQEDLDIIRKKYEAMGSSETFDENSIRWRIISGRCSDEATEPLLSKALAIFHESFDPIINVVTKEDLIPAMVYGRTVGNQDYSGMYCAVLTVGSRVVSTGLLRVLGSELAELPLVATSMELQGRGYFQALFRSIERLLASLKVKHFVLPAAEEAECIWTQRFGFSRVPPDQMDEFLKGAVLTAFNATPTLYKPLTQS